MRAVLDPNVLIAALLSPAGAPAALVLGWFKGASELIVSEQLLQELSRALAYPKLQARVSEPEAAAFAQLLRSTATVAPDPAVAALRSRDRGDDYLLALAQSTAAILVSGDLDLLSLAAQLPVTSPADFLKRIESETF